MYTITFTSIHIYSFIILTALECPFLRDPMNGHVTCIQPVTTGGMCQYSCDVGFDLVGRNVRICLPSSKWSGSTPYCKPRLCDELEPPMNGFTLLPCTREYRSSCRIDCKPGYKINGTEPFMRTCIIDSNSQLKWTDPAECVGK